MRNAYGCQTMASARRSWFLYIFTHCETLEPVDTNCCLRESLVIKEVLNSVCVWPFFFGVLERGAAILDRRLCSFDPPPTVKSNARVSAATFARGKFARSLRGLDNLVQLVILCHYCERAATARRPDPRLPLS